MPLPKPSDALLERARLADRAAGSVMLAGGRPARLAWIGAGTRHAILCWTEEAFDAAMAKACGRPGQTTFPWIHAGTGLSALCRAAVHANPKSAGWGFEEMDVNMAGERENQFSHSRMRNSIRLFRCRAPNLEDAADALLRAIPGGWTFSSEKLDAKKMEELAKAPAPDGLDPTAFDLLSCPLFDWRHIHDAAYRACYSQSQVDGAGRAWSLWIPAAARALGCPAEITTSVQGYAIMGMGDVYGEANRIASEDPDLFMKKFAGAIEPLDPAAMSDFAKRHGAELKADKVFEQRDRGAVELESIRDAAPTDGALPQSPRRRL